MQYGYMNHGSAIFYAQGDRAYKITIHRGRYRNAPPSEKDKLTVSGKRLSDTPRDDGRRFTSMLKRIFRRLRPWARPSRRNGPPRGTNESS
jgi:hypothetical protein